MSRWRLGSVVFLSFLLKLWLIPWFYHPDMKTQYFHFQFLSKGIVNIYQFLDKNRKQLPYRDTFNYQPLTYLIFGGVHSVLKPIMPADFSAWLNDWGPNQNQYANLPVFLLILKLPYLTADILIGYLLWKLTRSKGMFFFWLLNPLSFYLIYILGNFDVVVVLTSLAALYLIERKKENLGFLILGLGTALKLYPVLFLPFFLWKAKKNWLKNIIWFVSIPGLSILPWINSREFWSAFIGSGLSQKLLALRMWGVPVFMVGYLLILGRQKWGPKIALTDMLFYLGLLFVSTVRFHPQWLLWFYPWVIMAIYNKKQLWLPTGLLALVLIINILLFDDQYLSWGHLIPIDNDFVLLTSPYNLIRLKFLLNPVEIQNKVRWLIGLWSLIILGLDEKNRRSVNN